MSKKRTRASSSLDALFDVASQAMEVTRLTAEGADVASGTHLLALQSIRPDPFQARRVLPPAVREGFLSGQLDAPGALAAWRSLAEDDVREAELLQSQIVSLAGSIQQQNLVNPITVCPDGQGGYLIETGERRWWAHWWLVSVEQATAFEQIRVQIVALASPERQAAENLQDSPLTAVQEACQIARLMLHLTGRDSDHVVTILAGQDSEETRSMIGYLPYRAALELDRTDVYGKWSVISQIMARGERQLLRQLAILKLSDAALSLADRAGLTEGQLRPLVTIAAEVTPDRQHRIVSMIADYGLSGSQVAELVKAADLDNAEKRIRRRLGLDEPQKKDPVAIRRPSSIMVERLRGVRRLAARQEKGGLQISDLMEEVLASGQADSIYQELDELAEMLNLLREQLAQHIGR